MIHQFVPKDLERLYLIEWFIIWPTEIFLTMTLHLDSAIEEPQFKLIPQCLSPIYTGNSLQGSQT